MQYQELAEKLAACGIRKSEEKDGFCRWVNPENGRSIVLAADPEHELGVETLTKTMESLNISWNEIEAI